MSEIETFVENYGDANRSRLACAWNGKHAEEFVDANQCFRDLVIKHVRERSGSASPSLLFDLLRAESEWARVTGRAPSRGYAALAGLVLTRGGVGSLDTFLDCFAMSFDTFGACHQIRIDEKSLAVLCYEAADRLSKTTYPAMRRRVKGAQDLFERLRAGTARNGWVLITVAPRAAETRVVSKPKLVLRGFVARMRDFFSGRQ